MCLIVWSEILCSNKHGVLWYHQITHLSRKNTVSQVHWTALNTIGRSANPFKWASWKSCILFCLQCLQWIASDAKLPSVWFPDVAPLLLGNLIGTFPPNFVVVRFSIFQCNEARCIDNPTMTLPFTQATPGFFPSFSIPTLTVINDPFYDCYERNAPSIVFCLTSFLHCLSQIWHEVNAHAMNGS
jgi:hypothetical protein